MKNPFYRPLRQGTGLAFQNATDGRPVVSIKVSRCPFGFAHMGGPAQDLVQGDLVGEEDFPLLQGMFLFFSARIPLQIAAIICLQGKNIIAHAGLRVVLAGGGNGFTWGSASGLKISYLAVF